MDTPTKEDAEKFWKPLYENKKEYNKNAVWLQGYEVSINNTTEAIYSEITTNQIESATSEFSNWKTPGLDKLHNFWWNIAFDKLIVHLRIVQNC